MPGFSIMRRGWPAISFNFPRLANVTSMALTAANFNMSGEYASLSQRATNTYTFFERFIRRVHDKNFTVLGQVLRAFSHGTCAIDMSHSAQTTILHVFFIVINI